MFYLLHNLASCHYQATKYLSFDQLFGLTDVYTICLQKGINSVLTWNNIIFEQLPQIELEEFLIFTVSKLSKTIQRVYSISNSNWKRDIRDMH